MKTHMDLRCSRRLTVAEGRMLIALLEAHGEGKPAAKVLAKLREAYTAAIGPRTPMEERLASYRTTELRRRLGAAADRRTSQASLRLVPPEPKPAPANVYVSEGSQRVTHRPKPAPPPPPENGSIPIW